MHRAPDQKVRGSNCCLLQAHRVTARCGSGAGDACSLHAPPGSGS
ncbi:hypothetical protein SGM_4497 [Streptomyces griseoaurantiacus M045]|uniref:Uncharacterized protein n=1 Tax=Streptomyces griseoaurantiacus M045 TaxID=996637 RepID=F3NMY3_9ACTN|nr:hypothetical protein SGM_4497 [Streptomyces griseoaurantiacus M045]